MIRAGWLLALLLAGATPAAAGECPAALAGATRLVMVVAPAMASRQAQVTRFSRASPAEPWQAEGASRPAALGRNGLGWSWIARALAAEGEPVKSEGDGRTPAGIFRIGRAFGFDGETGPSYLRLERDAAYCVDDPRSEHYNTVVPRRVAGKGTSGEAMRDIPLYRHGLFVDYPTNRRLKGGSCIFVHVWRAPGTTTSGCVALASPDVIALQDFATGAETAIAILPLMAVGRLSGCVPGR